MIEHTLKLLADAPEGDRWYIPFPMGVFGTLRTNQHNNRRMHAGNVSLLRKAFMPHFVAHGLSISYRKDSSAPFEVFFYSPEEWVKMIPGVDALEGFMPERNTAESHWNSYGYYRTLAWLHLLPDDYEHDLFGKNLGLGQHRDLQIPTEQWSDYERVPCWVYSSRNQNEKAKDCGTVIWG